MFMLGAWMFVFVRMRFSGCLVGLLVPVKLIAPGMAVFVHHRHMDVEMGMLFVCQQQRTRDHQNRRDDKQPGDWISENKEGQQYARERSRAVQGAGARRAQSAHGVDEEHGAESIADEAEQEDDQDDGKAGSR